MCSGSELGERGMIDDCCLFGVFDKVGLIEPDALNIGPT